MFRSILRDGGGVFGEHAPVTNSIAYMVVVSVLGVGSLLWALWWLNRAEASRRIRLVGRTWFEGTKTKTPLDDPSRSAREQGLDNIRRQTTVIRRSVVPLILAVTVLLAITPMLGELPTAMVSVVVGLISVTAGIAEGSLCSRVWRTNVRSLKGQRSYLAPRVLCRTGARRVRHGSRNIDLAPFGVSLVV